MNFLSMEMVCYLIFILDPFPWNIFENELKMNFAGANMCLLC